MRCLVLSLLLLSRLGLAGAALAEGPPEGPPGPPHPHDLVREHADALGIDAETVESIQQIALADRDERRALQEASKGARETLGELLEAESPDRDAVMAQVDTVGAAETALLKQRLSTLLAMRELLTPAQIAALGAMSPGSGPPGGGPPPPAGGGPPPGPPPPMGPGMEPGF